MPKSRMDKVGAIIVDSAGRRGKIAGVFADGIMAHPIEVGPVVNHRGLKIQTTTWWQRFGMGYSGKWFDSPIGSYWLKAKIDDDN